MVKKKFPDTSVADFLSVVNVPPRTSIVNEILPEVSPFIGSFPTNFRDRMLMDVDYLT